MIDFLIVANLLVMISGPALVVAQNQMGFHVIERAATAFMVCLPVVTLSSGAFGPSFYWIDAVLAGAAILYISFRIATFEDKRPKKDRDHRIFSLGSVPQYPRFLHK